MSDVRVLKNKLATIPGKSILSTIDTMSALGDLGREVLRQYGIEKIDPTKQYSYKLRRAIHEAAY